MLPLMKLTTDCNSCQKTVISLQSKEKASSPLKMTFERGFWSSLKGITGPKKLKFIPLSIFLFFFWEVIEISLKSDSQQIVFFSVTLMQAPLDFLCRSLNPQTTAKMLINTLFLSIVNFWPCVYLQSLTECSLCCWV